jgi:hypothetical protein
VVLRIVSHGGLDEIREVGRSYVLHNLHWVKNAAKVTAADELLV